MDPLTFAERLRNFRRKKRFCQKEVAVMLGISRVYYCRLENGKANPSFELQSRISAFLESGAASLFSTTEISQDELCELCRSLTERDRKAIAEIILRRSGRLAAGSPRKSTHNRKS